MEIKAAPSDLDLRVAARLKDLRAQRGLTLDELAKESGVSRSMISFIERAESSPTARVLDKLAASLGVPLAALFVEEEHADASPISRRAEQPEWLDPETGYHRRNLSPAGFPSPVDLIEVVMPPKARVAYDGVSRTVAVYHQVWVIEGVLEVSLGDELFSLQSGDCLAIRLDSRPITYRNPSDESTRYIVVTVTDAVMLRVAHD